MPQRIVIKLGTSVLTGGTARLDEAHMLALAAQCAQLRAAGHEIILCSSGAIAAGRSRMGLEAAPVGMAERQMLAAVGQSRLMGTWERCFDGHDLRVGQILLTRADVEHRERYLNARDALNAMLAHGVIPIVNENDAVAIAEIKLGDNDNLSALLALLAEADLLLILTDQPGLFTSDPRLDPDAQLIAEVPRVSASVRATASGSVSGVGTGGMTTKIQAAEMACRGGTTVVVASGRAPDVIPKAARGEAVGTRFAPTETPIEHRKKWIMAGPRPRAALIVDGGAAAALRTAGSSLLPAGIARISGRVNRGDAVLIKDESGSELARGISRYDGEELLAIRGIRSDAIAGVLGYTRGAAAVHRNDIVLANE